MKFNEWIVGQVNGVDVKYMIKLKSESGFMKLISYLLFWQRKTFMENYYTTIGRVMYVPTETPDSATLEHELIHVYDYQSAPVLFVWSYLFLLPSVWTWRAKWERRAYGWQMKRLNHFDHEWAKSQFCASRYLWMWPFPESVSKWVDQVKSGEYAPIKSVVLVKQ